MPPTILIDNEYATLVYHPDKKIIHHTFHRHITGERFREVLNCGISAFIEQGASKWLSDDRKNMELTPEDTEWGNNVWFPSVLKAGWKSWALVVPEDVMASWNMSQFIQRFSSQGIRIMVFTDPNDAMQWLESV